MTEALSQVQFLSINQGYGRFSQIYFLGTTRYWYFFIPIILRVRMESPFVKPESRIGEMIGEDGRKSAMSHTAVKFTPHKLFPPRLKIRSESLNPKIWSFKKKEEFLSSRPISREAKNPVSKYLKEKLIPPGPGEYEVMAKQKPPLGMILRQPVHKLISNIDSVGPGPGFYNITTVWKGRESKPAFSSTKLLQLFDLINQPTPGPCDYQKQLGNRPIVSKYRSSSTHIIPQSTRESIIKQSKLLTPGPGDYNIGSDRPKAAKKAPYKFLHRYMV